MVAPIHLKNAPITEALVDISVKPSQGVDIIRLGSMDDPKYPTKKKRMRFEGQIDFQEGKPTMHKDAPPWVDGYIYISKDEKYVAQFRLDGFSISRLKPYETWEKLRDEAVREWGTYLKIASPEVVTRVALRYINRLELPRSMGDFNEYLTTPPTIPKNLPQKMSSFLMRVVVPEETIGAFAIITQTLKRVVHDFVPVILDIDTFKNVQTEVDKNEIWDVVDKLRRFKNDVFFGSITEKTKELYQ